MVEPIPSTRVRVGSGVAVGLGVLVCVDVGAMVEVGVLVKVGGTDVTIGGRTARAEATGVAAGLEVNFVIPHPTSAIRPSK